MKVIYFFIFFFISVQLSASSENTFHVWGSVLDKTTQSPMQYVQVYASGTTLGCMTDVNGRFSFYVPKGYHGNLIASMVGYEVFSEEMAFEEREFCIWLNSKDQGLTEITVVGVNNRLKNIKAFKRVFLSADEYGHACSLLNDSVVQFTFEKDYYIVKNRAPLKFHNRKLAYYVSADIAFCGYDYREEHSLILADLFFVDLLDSKSNTVYKEILANRRRAYLGNRQHFLKSLFENDLAQQGFFVVASNGADGTSLDLNLNDSSVACVSENYIENNSVLNASKTQRIFHLDKNLVFHVFYFEKFGKPRDLSEELVSPYSTRMIKHMINKSNKEYYSKVLLRQGDTFNVSCYGNTGMQLFFLGRMGKSRYGNQLPYDYDYEL